MATRDRPIIRGPIEWVVRDKPIVGEKPWHVEETGV